MGDKKVFVLDILKNKGSFYEIPDRILEKIMDVKFTSYFDKET